MADPLDSFRRRWRGGSAGRSGSRPRRRPRAGRPSSAESTLILAPTGSGKTLAAFLWSIDEIYRELAEDRDRTGVRLLYVSPLKALNNDIERNLRAAGGHPRNRRGLRSAASAAARLRAHGRHPAAARQAMVRKPPHILITTPESLYLILSSPRPRYAQDRADGHRGRNPHPRRGEARGPPDAQPRTARTPRRATHPAHRAVRDRAPAGGGRAVPGGQTFGALPDGESTNAAGTPRSGRLRLRQHPGP